MTKRVTASNLIEALLTLVPAETKAASNAIHKVIEYIDSEHDPNDTIVEFE